MSFDLDSRGTQIRSWPDSKETQPQGINSPSLLPNPLDISTFLKNLF